MKIIVEFLGGCLDGGCIDGTAESRGDLETVDYAAFCYQLTDGGQPGRRFWMLSDATRTVLRRVRGPSIMPVDLMIRRHYYEVTDRVVQGESVLLRVREAPLHEPGEATED